MNELTELIIEEYDKNDNSRIRYFSVPTKWLEEKVLPDYFFGSVRQFLDEYTSEESNDVYCRALLENKVFNERVSY